MEERDSPSGVKTALVFPIYSGTKEYRDISLEAYQNCRNKGATIYVIDDGLKHAETANYFNSEFLQCNCVFIGLYPQSGLTRSWNLGAAQAFNDGNDVVILGNCDAWPDKTHDLEHLSLKAYELRRSHYAVGPTTNSPGHVKAQHRDGPGDVEAEGGSVDYVNGFTWAIHRENYQNTMSRRGFFLMDRPDKVYCMKNGVQPFSGKRSHSLAMVGQEDEVFSWARRNLDKKCSIVHPSFWWHKKLSLYRECLV